MQLLLYWQAKCIQTKTVCKKTKVPHTASVTIWKHVCPRDTKHTAAQWLHSHLVCMNYAVHYLHEFFFFFFSLCVNRYSAQDQMQIMSQYLQSSQIAGKDSLWLNLLMSRLSLIRNQLLIQIHTLMFLETQRAYYTGPNTPSRPLYCHIVDLQVLGEPKGT